MAHTVKRLRIAVFVIFIAVLFALSVCVPQANAADAHDSSRSAVIHLTGRHADGKYELNTKDLYLFSLEGTAPGDRWSGSVKVQNDTDGDMAVAVHSIASTLKQDKTLFETLDLKISVEGETCYLGDYAAKGSPVTEYYPVAAGKSMSFDIVVTFPAYAGNECQGKQMDSTWTFQAMYFEPEANSQKPSGTGPGGSDVNPPAPVDDIIQTGHFMITSNTELITCLILFLLSGAGLVWMTIRCYKARKHAAVSTISDDSTEKESRKEDA